MEALIFFAIWAGLIFLMMRFGCGAHVTGRGHGQAGGETGDAQSRKFHWTPPERDADPVCGKTVATAKAKPSVHDGKVCFFCSPDCREIFEAVPDLYFDGRDPGHSELEHSHA